MFHFSSGLSALRANQVALDTIGHNIANANTPGYHRQVTQLADRLPWQDRNLLIGTGVDVAGLQRIRHQFTEESLTRNIAALADATSRVTTLRSIESLMAPGSGSLHDRLQSFFDDLAQLSARPDDAAIRQIFVQAAVSLTDQVNATASGLTQLAEGLEADIRRTVTEINERSAEIAELNRAIQLTEVRGLPANDLRDRRDQLVNELAALIDARIVEQGEGQSVVLVGQGAGLIGRNPLQLQVEKDASGNIIVTHPGLNTPVDVGGGKLAGLLAARNQSVPKYVDQLAEFVAALATGIDGAHATGLGLSGPLNQLFGQRGVSDVAVPLAEADSAFPIQAGALFISVTDRATGARTLHAVAVDPATDSLQDLAATISGIDHVQAVVNTQSGELQILAEPGYGFDFAGRLPTVLDMSGITGTATASLSGAYTGTTNEQFTFDVVGTGTVGVTTGLTLEIRDAAGQLIATLDVGEGYEPGSALNVADGISVHLESGALNAGDTFASRIVSQPDTAGMLTALGLNTLFVGRGAAGIKVNPILLENPDLLATSQTGAVGDDGNLRDMLALRDTPLLAGGSETLEQYLANLITQVGDDVRDTDLVRENLELRGQYLQVERESISGVDPNEELVKMLQFQKGFQAAARHIATIDETLDDLFRIVG